MKKIFTAFIALALALVLFTVPAFAEETADTAPETSTEVETPETEAPTTPENTAPSEEENFYGEVVDYFSNGFNWAKIGGVVVAILAAVAAITANLNKVTSILSGISNLVKGKATKEETEKIVGDNLKELKKTYDEQYADLKEKYDDQAERNTELTAVLTVVALQLVKSPYARTEIMGLISGTKKVNGDVKDIVEAVEAEIEKAAAEEEKEPTPALDAIKASVNTTETAAASGGINMGW